MYLTALPEVVKNAASPLSQTDKIVMYGDGNATKVVKDVMTSTSQIMEGMKESTGIDLGALLAGIVGGRLAGGAPTAPEAQPLPEQNNTPEI
jgi:flotillin